MGACRFQGSQTGKITGGECPAHNKDGQHCWIQYFIFISPQHRCWSSPSGDKEMQLHLWPGAQGSTWPSQDGHAVFPSSIIFQNIFAETDQHFVQERQRMSQQLWRCGDLV